MKVFSVVLVMFRLHVWIKVTLLFSQKRAKKMLLWVLFRKFEGQFQSGLATRDAFEAVQDVDWSEHLVYGFVYCRWYSTWLACLLKNISIGRGEVFKSNKAMMTFILTTIRARFFDVVTISHQFEIYYSFSFIKILLEQIAQMDK